jgi:hypothetical protein
MDDFGTDDVENTSDAVKHTKLLAFLSQKFSFGVQIPKLVSLHSSQGLSRVKLSMLTFISPNVCPKWSKSSRNTTKMTKCLLSLSGIMPLCICNDTLEWLEQKNINIVPKTDTPPNVT